VIFVSTTGSITLFLLILFFVRVVLSDDIEVRVFRLERGLRHVAQIGRGLAIVTAPLLDLVLRDLENTQILRQIFHCKTVLWWQIFDLFHGVHACVELGENLAELDIVEFLYKDEHDAGLPPLNNL
jgi:hypothetical protein